MTEWKAAVSLLAALIVIYSYIPYVASMLHGKNKPHMFSWLIWTLTSWIAGAAQLAKGAGYGAWVLLCVGFLCLTVAVTAIWYGEKKITRIDWILFLLALAAIPLWIVMQDPLPATILVTLIDTCGFGPTVRKSWHRPSEENAQMYILSAIQYPISIVAIEHYNLTTLLYPMSLFVLNAIFVALLLYRRAVLGETVRHAA